MPKKVYVRSVIDGELYHVNEGSIYTQPAFQQWYGWTIKPSYRHRPGLRDQYHRKTEDLIAVIRYIEKLIAADLTYTSTYDNAVEKVIDEYDEERFVEELEYLRDSVNDVLNSMAKRRPLQRRIELMERVLDPSANAEPGEVEAAKAAIERLKRRLND
jgi:hypothetical protein